MIFILANNQDKTKENYNNDFYGINESNQKATHQEG